MVVSGFFLKGGRLVDVRYSSTPPRKASGIQVAFSRPRLSKLLFAKFPSCSPKKPLGGNKKEEPGRGKGLGGKLETVKGFASCIYKVGTYTLED